jgi:hypothetical protein
MSKYGRQAMSHMGHGLLSRRLRRHGRCTSDSCRIIGRREVVSLGPVADLTRFAQVILAVARYCYFLMMPLIAIEAADANSAAEMSSAARMPNKNVPS